LPSSSSSLAPTSYLLLVRLFLLPPPSLLSSTNAALAVSFFFPFNLVRRGGGALERVGWGGAVDPLGTHAAALSHHSSYFLSRDFLFLIGVGVTHFCPPREISIPNCLDHPIHFCPGCCRRRFPSDQSWVLGLGFWLSNARRRRKREGGLRGGAFRDEWEPNTVRERLVCVLENPFCESGFF